LVAYFLAAAVNQASPIGRLAVFFRKYMQVFAFAVGSVMFIFLFVFLAGGAKIWIAVFGTAFIVLAGMMVRTSNPITVSMILAGFLLFVFAQSSLMEKAGVTTHATLQGFAAAVQEEIASGAPGTAVIGVGSHDIHEKEFQAYFDQKVVKAAGSEPEQTRSMLMDLFRADGKVYCLITEKDYNDILKDAGFRAVEVIGEDYMFRRRIKIDRSFFTAIVRMDRETVRDYLKEKVLLVRRLPHA
jgi:hypothetical protein